jgi:hypothetical protein
MVIADASGVYATPACRYRCAVKANCTTSLERRIKRWEHEEVIEAMQARLDRMPGAMRVRRRTVEHVFGSRDGAPECRLSAFCDCKAA